MSSTPTSYASLVERAMAHVGSLQAAHEQMWHMSDAVNADVDLAVGQITWNLADRLVTAPVELLGTWDPADQTFLWGWDHPSVRPGTAGASTATRDFAIEHGIAELQPSKVSCSFDDTWSLAAPAVMIGDLQGIYRMETSPGGAWAFLGFGQISISARSGT
ncbi:MAG: DUF6882 domain-containing protein [Actinomycetota bacterium]